MSKASILRQLSDDDLEAIHHLIRRDALSDREIARTAEVRGQKSAKKYSLGPTDEAKEMVVARYRQSPQYKKWLSAWENRDAELRKVLETQKQRFEFISNLTKDTDKTGLETVSKSLQARRLALAAETDDETFKMASGGKGWIDQALKLAQADVRDSYRRKVEELRAEIERMMNAPKGKPVKTEDLVAKVDEVMGIRK